MTSPGGVASTWRPPVVGGFWVDGPFPCDDATHEGPLAGVDIAVKDNVAVLGRVVGNGNPTFASSAAPADATAPCIVGLLVAGAALRGRVMADEFAYSLMGVNAHLGTPRNERWPTGVPGGSSSGCAAAVAAGAVALAVGTDTGGSIRVPASYCGLAGYRPTHGRIDITGATPLSPTFDTVGLLVGGDQIGLLQRAAAVLLQADEAEGGPVREVVMARDLIAIADPDMGAAVTAAAGAMADALGVPVSLRDVLPIPVAELRDAFTTLQGYEAWRALGPVVGPLARNDLGLAPDILERFERASTITPADAAAADEVRRTVRDTFHDLTVDGGILVQPAAAGTPPARDSQDGQFAAARQASLALTAPAGLAGMPVVVVPSSSPNEAPRGVAFVGGRNTDEALIAAVGATRIHRNGSAD